MTAEELRKELGLPPLSQLGIVVHDVEKAAKYYESILGVEPFYIYQMELEKHWYFGKPSPFKAIMGKSQWNNIELELVHPLVKESLHYEYLQKCGEGLQHLGFDVADFDSVHKRFLKAGFEAVMFGESYYPAYDGWVKAAYYDTYKVGGIAFEVMWRSWVTPK
jgi:methylmalonyl-CoA/ethylmalonyl-CoA epimerase